MQGSKQEEVWPGSEVQEPHCKSGELVGSEVARPGGSRSSILSPALPLAGSVARPSGGRKDIVSSLLLPD